jgi:2-C-methyl-D-erythritol 2,4-cyclodiphosphate synthase
VSYRVGSGFDSHLFSEDPARPLVLGGVVVAETGGLSGHSDADVVAHAVADAMLGAAGLGTIGEMFPDSDPLWSGADSVGLLERVRDAVAGAGWRLVNADCSVALERPVIAGLRPAMEKRLGAAAGGPVSVKPKRPEGAAAGAGGVSCWAAVLLEPDEP